MHVHMVFPLIGHGMTNKPKTLDALNLTQGNSNSVVCQSNLRFLGLDALSLFKDSLNKDSLFKAFRVYKVSHTLSVAIFH